MLKRNIKIEFLIFPWLITSLKFYFEILLWLTVITYHGFAYTAFKNNLFTLTYRTSALIIKSNYLICQIRKIRTWVIQCPVPPGSWILNGFQYCSLDSKFCYFHYSIDTDIVNKFGALFLLQKCFLMTQQNPNSPISLPHFRDGQIKIYT